MPYIVLSEDIGAAGVVSLDHHITAMGGIMAEPDVIMQIRQYARAKSVELTIQLGGYSLTVVGMVSVMGVGEQLVTLAQLSLDSPYDCKLRRSLSYWQELRLQPCIHVAAARLARHYARG